MADLCSTSHAQFPWQRPVNRDPAEIERIVGPIRQREPSRDLNIVWVWGIGHNYFTLNDPYFRIILLRAMAWTMNESFDPFKPLVTLHLER